ncbi:MAG TPA: tetratricopeptide repeat protein [Candidatus Binatia bacterium]|jgi:tetratricopeptide (TPR) repeat protein|nr:tetratricopeptide repeat protein [Candidatus Binatia bacterium]
MPRLQCVWGWLSNKKNQTTLAFISGGLIIAVGGIWQAYLYFSEKPKEAPKVTAAGGGIAAGENISATASPGGTAIVATGNVTIGIMPEQFATELKRREQETRHELAQASAGDREKIALLEKQLADIQAKFKNPQAALADYKATLEQARQALDHLQGEFLAEQLERVRQELANGDASEAEMLFRQVLLVSGDKEKRAESAYQLGQLAAIRIDYRSAYQYHKQAAELQPENPLYLIGVGALAYTVGHYSEAEPLYLRALTIWEKALGPEHPNVATSLNNLALLYRIQGQYAKAEPLLQRALTIREKALGPEHPAVAQSLNNLAGLYRDQGQYAKEEPLYRRALTIREKALGPEHPNVATCLENYSVLLRKLNRAAEAAAMEARADAIRAKH